MTVNEDLTKAWGEGFTAATEYAVARRHWASNGGELPQRPMCPYAVIDAVQGAIGLNCEMATNLFEQHKGR